jgi:hypothetical protein
MELMLPGKTGWEELDAVTNEYKTLLRNRRVAGRRMGSTARALEDAIRKDLEALKEALVAGQPDPGPSREEKAKKEAEAARRRYEALDLAIEDVEIKLIDVIDAHRDEWATEMDEKVETARAEFELTLQELEARRSRLALRRGVRYWLEHFPEQPSFRFGIGPVFGLIAPHGDAYRWDEVIAALTAEAAPPPEPTPVGDATTLLPRPM